MTTAAAASHYKPEEIVDGGGLILSEHAKGLAEALKLNSRQVSMLVAEVRNALVGGYSVDDSPAPRLNRGAERVLFLMEAATALQIQPDRLKTGHYPF